MLKLLPDFSSHFFAYYTVREDSSSLLHLMNPSCATVFQAQFTVGIFTAQTLIMHMVRLFGFHRTIFYDEQSWLPAHIHITSPHFFSYAASLWVKMSDSWSVHRHSSS